MSDIETRALKRKNERAGETDEKREKYRIKGKGKSQKKA